jgi:predicted lipid-binding transport protein (Tim44 family)
MTAMVTTRLAARRRFPLLAMLAALAMGVALVVAPGSADARAGGGYSFGSRGSQTWAAPPSTRTAPSVAPMQRSMTPNAPSYAPTPGAGFAQPGLAGGRSPFVSGLMGGLIGAGLAGLLFGHGLFGGFSGFGSFIGFLIQIFLIVWVVRWLFRRFWGPAYAGGGPGMFARVTGGGQPGGGQPGGGQPVGARAAMQGGMQGGMPGAGAPAGIQKISITATDYQQFEQLLKAVQDAWSRADLHAVQQLATPEMVSYFAEQLAEFSSRGVRNMVSDVRLEQGDLAQAWREGDREYATVAMRFSMIDVTRDGAGNVVDGSPTERQSATEVWTFMRVPGGRWLLSAIQQAR